MAKLPAKVKKQKVQIEETFEFELVKEGKTVYIYEAELGANELLTTTRQYISKAALKGAAAPDTITITVTIG